MIGRNNGEPASIFQLCVFALCSVIATGSLAWQADTASDRDDSSSVYTSDKLLKINIQLDPDDWHALRISHRTPEPEKIADDPYIYYKADVEIDGVTLKSAGVRKKGFFGSVVSTRPSLKIRFDKWNEDQLFHGLDQLTLNNNVQDASQMQQYLAYWLFDRAGAITPRCNFALVTVNGESLGIYSNVESIRDPFLERVFGNSKGKLYEGYAGDIVDNEIDFSRMVRKNGKPDAGRKVLKNARDLLKDPDVELDEIAKILDLNAFITFWASEVLMGHWDSYSGNRNNFYLYRDKESRKFFFVPWGTDSIFQDPGPFIQQSVPRSVKAVGVVSRRLWEFPEIQERYENEMRRLLKEVWIEKEIYAEMDRVQAMLKPHMAIDPARVRGSIENAKSFIKSRRAEFLAELDGPPPEWPKLNQALPGGVATIASMMEITGSFETRMNKADPENVFDNGTATLRVSIDGKEQKDMFKRVGVFAKPEQPGFIRPGYPVVQLVGIRGKDKPPVYLQLIIDPIRMVKEKPSLQVDHFCVWATMVSGEFDSPDAERRIFGVMGTLELDQCDPQPNGVFAGTFKIRTQAFRK